VNKCSSVHSATACALLQDPLFAVGGWVGGVTTRPTAAEHRYSVAGKEERRKERSRRKGKEREEGAAGQGSRAKSHLVGQIHCSSPGQQLLQAPQLVLLGSYK
jgi:hypothetical protein